MRDGELGRQRYFAVYFGNTTKVTQVGVWQTLVMPHLATEFEVSYSLDGLSWFSEETVRLSRQYSKDESSWAYDGKALGLVGCIVKITCRGYSKTETSP